jgi:nucleoid-associated protein YgaU
MSGLVKGEFDAIIYDYPFGANEIEDYNSKIVISNKNLNGEDLNNYVLVVNKRTPGAGDLLIKINDAIQKFKRSEKYSDAIAEYIPNSNAKNISNINPADSYTIQKGETLSIIARDKMGDVTRWSEIYNLNKDILASPDIIYSGQIIRKPSGWN